MGAFATLVWKEWRDVRAVTLVAAALVPVAVGVLAWATRDWRSGELLALAALPALAGLYWVALASDVVAGDATSGRLATLAALPVRPWKLFGAKLAFLVGAGLAFALWVLAVETAVVTAFGSEHALASFGRALPDALVLLAVCAAVAAATAFVSTVGPGGVAAVVLACIGLGTGGWLAYERARGWSYPLASDEVACGAGLVAVAALAAAWIAFARGRVHLVPRARAASIGLGTLAVLLGVPVSAAAWRASEWLELVPGDEQAWLRWIVPSPNGRWLALVVHHEDVHDVEALWLVDVESGEEHVLGANGWGYGGWTRDGLLQAIVRSRSGDELVRVDPRTREVVARPSDEDFSAESLRGSCWAWARVRSSPGAQPPHRIERTDGGRPMAFDGERPYPQRPPGLVLHLTADGGLDLVDLDTGERRTLFADAPRRSWLVDALTTDARLGLFTIDGAPRLVEVETGAVVAGPWPDRWALWADRSDRFLGLHGSTDVLIFDVETGRETSFARCLRWCVLPDGRIVALRDDGRLELLGVDGAFQRLLLATR